MIGVLKRIAPLMIAALFVSACASREFAAGGVPSATVRARAEMERVVAVGQPGTRVCRETRFGIGNLDWLRGTVVAAEGRQLAVRIDDAGHSQHVLNGISVKKGAVIRDEILAWIPCGS